VSVKLALPADLVRSLEATGARVQTLPAQSRPEGELVRSWRSMATHLKAQADLIVQQDMAAQRAAGREPFGYIPPDAKELLARANTYDLCAIELATALGIRG
jgi:hypothetical protein